MRDFCIVKLALLFLLHPVFLETQWHVPLRYTTLGLGGSGFNHYNSYIINTKYQPLEIVDTCDVTLKLSFFEPLQCMTSLFLSSFPQ